MNLLPPLPSRFASSLLRYGFLLGILALSAAASSIFACATPFAAFAVYAAYTLSRTEGFCFVVAAWLLNQAVGYGLLNYDQNVLSYGWGLLIGLATVAAFVAAQFAKQYTAQSSEAVGLGIALAAAFVSYEAVLYIAALTPMGGLDTFSAEIIGQIGATNALALLALCGVQRLTRLSSAAYSNTPNA